MGSYIFKRILSSSVLIFLITIKCFLLINMIPSDPAEVALRVRQTPVITEEAIEQVRVELGLDKPIMMRYGRWLSDALKLDFGVSYVNPSRTVLGEIARTLPSTLKLSAAAMLLVVLIGVPLGLISGLYANKSIDLWIRRITFISTSMPTYYSALLMIWIFSLKLHLLPTSGSGSFKSIIMPAIAVALSQMATYIRLIRANVINVLKEDYILYAHVRGLKKWHIVSRHVFKNSMQSSLSVFGMGIPQLIAGTLVVENVFSWPGLGKLCISAVFNRDYPIIQFYVLFMGILFVVSNLCFDILTHWIDPRTRKGGA